jgi:hypothetical protein
MLGTIAAAVCAAFLLYGAWIVLRELIERKRKEHEASHPEGHAESRAQPRRALPL